MVTFQEFCFDEIESVNCKMRAILVIELEFQNIGILRNWAFAVHLNSTENQSLEDKFKQSSEVLVGKKFKK